MERGSSESNLRFFHVVQKRGFALFVIVFSFLFSLSFIFALEPSGVNPTEINSSSAQADNAGSVAAVAGNVTELNIFGYSSTQSWQGYYGNVTGAIRLANAADDVFYNWSLTSPSGEIYASVNDSVNWTGTACYDLSTELTALESFYNIDPTDVDGIDETFTLKNHDGFFVNNIEIVQDTCNSTRIFGDTGQGEDTEFEEVILKAGSGEVVWASILDSDLLGFDGKSHDFQMLVPEDGHNGDTSTTQYYFWVELE